MDLAKRIRAVGETAVRTKKDEQGRPVRKVKCQGCGEEISSDGSLEGVEYVKTKRGTELFIHTRCMGNVWNHGIC